MIVAYCGSSARQHSESRRTRESQQLCPVAALGPCGADADTQDQECPVREKSTVGSDSWCKAPSHGSTSTRGPGKLTHLSLSESGTEDQKKDMCLLVTKRII